LVGRLGNDTAGAAWSVVAGVGAVCPDGGAAIIGALASRGASTSGNSPEDAGGVAVLGESLTAMSLMDRSSVQVARFLRAIGMMGTCRTP